MQRLTLDFKSQVSGPLRTLIYVFIKKEKKKLNKNIKNKQTNKIKNNKNKNKQKKKQVKGCKHQNITFILLFYTILVL